MRKFLSLALLALIVPAGCTTDSKAKADAQAAFLAGQQQAWTQLQQLRPNSVRVLGPVRQPVVEWTETLTLAEALVAAGYQGARDPRLILVHRAGQQIRVDPRRLLQGADLPLQAGDTVEIRP